MVRKRGIPTPPEVIEGRRDAIFKAMLDNYYLEANRPYNATKLSKMATEYCRYGRISPKNVADLLEGFVEQGLISKHEVEETKFKIKTFQYSISTAREDYVHMVAEYITGVQIRAA